jgi:hypothetical protein
MLNLRMFRFNLRAFYLNGVNDLCLISLHQGMAC